MNIPDHSPAHIGKIARLPLPVREELNRRLENGETAAKIFPWLKALPEAQAVLTASFAGSPVNPQNLSNWRRGGYQDWLKTRRGDRLVREVALEAGNIVGKAANQNVAKNLSTVLMVQMCVESRKIEAENIPPAKQLAHLGECLRAVGRVRHEDYLCNMLDLSRDRLALENRPSPKSGGGALEALLRGAKNQGGSR